METVLVRMDGNQRCLKKILLDANANLLNELVVTMLMDK